MYLKSWQLISVLADFFFVTSVFTTERFETILNFLDIHLESPFHVQKMIDGFFYLPINSAAYFALRNFNTMAITMFLNHVIKIFAFRKIKNIAFNPQLVYMQHFDRLNLKATDNISHFE